VVVACLAPEQPMLLPSTVASNRGSRSCDGHDLAAHLASLAARWQRPARCSLSRPRRCGPM